MQDLCLADVEASLGAVQWDPRVSQMVLGGTALGGPAVPQQSRQSLRPTTTGDIGTTCLHPSVKNQNRITRSKAEIRRENDTGKDRIDAEKQQIREIPQKIQTQTHPGTDTMPMSIPLKDKQQNSNIKPLIGLRDLLQAHAKAEYFYSKKHAVQTRVQTSAREDFVSKFEQDVVVKMLHAINEDESRISDNCIWVFEQNNRICYGGDIEGLMSQYREIRDIIFSLDITVRPLT